jgi:hypothetical protein
VARQARADQPQDALAERRGALDAERAHRFEKKAETQGFQPVVHGGHVVSIGVSPFTLQASGGFSVSRVS